LTSTLWPRRWSNDPLSGDYNRGAIDSADSSGHRSANILGLPQLVRFWLRATLHGLVKIPFAISKPEPPDHPVSQVAEQRFAVVATAAAYFGGLFARIVLYCYAHTTRIKVVKF
jgi:hypothetical protein